MPSRTSLKYIPLRYPPPRRCLKPPSCNVHHRGSLLSSQEHSEAPLHPILATGHSRKQALCHQEPATSQSHLLSAFTTQLESSSTRSVPPRTIHISFLTSSSPSRHIQQGYTPGLRIPRYIATSPASPEPSTSPPRPLLLSETSPRRFPLSPTTPTSTSWAFTSAHLSRGPVATLS